MALSVSRVGSQGLAARRALSSATRMTALAVPRALRTPPKHSDSPRSCAIKKLTMRHRPASGPRPSLAQPKLADDVQVQNRYNAACAATLAACGQGKDDPPLDDAVKTRWRKQAIDWLTADLTAWSKILDSGPSQCDRPWPSRSSTGKSNRPGRDPGTRRGGQIACGRTDIVSWCSGSRSDALLAKVNARPGTASQSKISQSSVCVEHARFDFVCFRSRRCGV